MSSLDVLIGLPGDEILELLNQDWLDWNQGTNRNWDHWPSIRISAKIRPREIVFVDLMLLMCVIYRMHRKYSNFSFYELALLFGKRTKYNYVMDHKSLSCRVIMAGFGICGFVYYITFGDGWSSWVINSSLSEAESVWQTWFTVVKIKRISLYRKILPDREEEILKIYFK